MRHLNSARNQDTDKFAFTNPSLKDWYYFATGGVVICGVVGQLVGVLVRGREGGRERGREGVVEQKMMIFNKNN